MVGRYVPLSFARVVLHGREPVPEIHVRVRLWKRALIIVADCKESSEDEDLVDQRLAPSLDKTLKVGLRIPEKTA